MATVASVYRCHHTTTGILVARAIVAGDISQARALARGRLSWSLTESRAILGAGRYCERVYRAPKDIGRSVMGWL